MYRMLQFYKVYPILSQVATELSWSHYIELLSVENEEERKTYEILCIKNRWGRNGLREQIKNKSAKKYQKGQTVSGELGWSHYFKILSPEDKEEIRIFQKLQTLSAESAVIEVS